MPRNNDLSDDVGDGGIGRDALQRQLIVRGYPSDLPVALISRGASAAQRVVISSVRHAARDLGSSGLESPVLAVIGRVVTLRARLATRRGGEANEEFYLERERIRC